MDRSVRLTVFITVLVVIFVFGLVVAKQVLTGGGSQQAAAPDLKDINVYVYDEPRDLVGFELVDEQGKTATQDSLKGAWTFVFVGFTHCPDICPLALANLKKFDTTLPVEMPEPRYLLVSADPERDTPDRLRDYLSSFGERFHGLTGDLGTLRDLARSLGAVIVHRQADGETLVDHSGHISLLNPDGRLVALMQPPHSPERLREAFDEIYAWARANHPRGMTTP